MQTGGVKVNRVEQLVQGFTAALKEPVAAIEATPSEIAEALTRASMLYFEYAGVAPSMACQMRAIAGHVATARAAACDHPNAMLHDIANEDGELIGCDKCSTYWPKPEEGNRA